MILTELLEDILEKDETLLSELIGSLQVSGSPIKGRLIATNKRLIFLCEENDTEQTDSFYYDRIGEIAMRKSFKNEKRVLFEADDEIQMLQSIENPDDINEFMHIVESYL